MGLGIKDSVVDTIINKSAQSQYFGAYIRNATNTPNTANQTTQVAQIPREVPLQTLLSLIAYNPRVGLQVIQNAPPNLRGVQLKLQQQLQNETGRTTALLRNFNPEIFPYNANAIQRRSGTAVININGRDIILSGLSPEIQQANKILRDAQALIKARLDLEKAIARVEARLNKVAGIFNALVNLPGAIAISGINFLINKLQQLQAVYDSLVKLRELAISAARTIRNKWIAWRNRKKKIDKTIEKLDQLQERINKALERPRIVIFPKFPKLPRLSFSFSDFYAKYKKAREILQNKNGQFYRQLQAQIYSEQGFEGEFPAGKPKINPFTGQQEYVLNPDGTKRLIYEREGGIGRKLRNYRNKLRELRARVQTQQAIRTAAVDQAKRQVMENVRKQAAAIAEAQKQAHLAYQNALEKRAQVGAKKYYLKDNEYGKLITLTGDDAVETETFKNIFGDKRTGEAFEQKLVYLDTRSIKDANGQEVLSTNYGKKYVLVGIAERVVGARNKFEQKLLQTTQKITGVVQNVTNVINVTSDAAYGVIQSYNTLSTSLNDRQVKAEIVAGIQEVAQDNDRYLDLLNQTATTQVTEEQQTQEEISRGDFTGTVAAKDVGGVIFVPIQGTKLLDRPFENSRQLLTLTETTKIKCVGPFENGTLVPVQNNSKYYAEFTIIANNESGWITIDNVSPQINITPGAISDAPQVVEKLQIPQTITFKTIQDTTIRSAATLNSSILANISRNTGGILVTGLPVGLFYPVRYNTTEQGSPKSIEGFIQISSLQMESQKPQSPAVETKQSYQVIVDGQVMREGTANSSATIQDENGGNLRLSKRHVLNFIRKTDDDLWGLFIIVEEVYAEPGKPKSNVNKQGWIQLNRITPNVVTTGTTNLTFPGELVYNTSAVVEGVKTVQQRFNELYVGQFRNILPNGITQLNPDGRYGNNTAATVKYFERQRFSRETDGRKVTQEIWNALFGFAQPIDPLTYPGYELKYGIGITSQITSPSGEKKSNIYVKLLQDRLVELGYTPGTPDGQFGNNTKTAVQAYQTAKQINPTTGVVNEALWKEIFSQNAVTPTTTQTVEIPPTQLTPTVVTGTQSNFTQFTDAQLIAESITYVNGYINFRVRGETQRQALFDRQILVDAEIIRRVQEDRTKEGVFFQYYYDAINRRNDREAAERRTEIENQVADFTLRTTTVAGVTYLETYPQTPASTVTQGQNGYVVTSQAINPVALTTGEDFAGIEAQALAQERNNRAMYEYARDNVPKEVDGRVKNFAVRQVISSTRERLLVGPTPNTASRYVKITLSQLYTPANAFTQASGAIRVASQSKETFLELLENTLINGDEALLAEFMNIIGISRSELYNRNYTPDTVEAARLSFVNATTPTNNPTETSQQSQFSNIEYSTTQNVNIRRTPNGTIITTLPRNTKLKLFNNEPTVKTSNNEVWAKFQTTAEPPIIGFVAIRLVTPQVTQTESITPPNASADVVEYPAGKLFSRIGTNSGPYVKSINNRLRLIGLGEGIPENSNVYTSATERNVNTFQTLWNNSINPPISRTDRRRIGVDGRVGAETWPALFSISSNDELTKPIVNTSSPTTNTVLISTTEENSYRAGLSRRPQAAGYEDEVSSQINDECTTLCSKATITAVATRFYDTSLSIPQSVNLNDALTAASFLAKREAARLNIPNSTTVFAGSTVQEVKFIGPAFATEQELTAFKATVRYTVELY